MKLLKLFRTINVHLHRNISMCSKSMEKLSNNLENLIDNTDEYSKECEQLVNRCYLNKAQSCFIIHPFVKWGPKKEKDTTAENRLSEAVALINTLTGWTVYNQLIIPLESLDKKTLFGSGTLEKLKKQVRQNRNITALFINVETLKNRQISELEVIFGVTILDRYKIVMHILKQHAVSKHAKLQVALAEIPYLRSRLKYIDNETSNNWDIKDRMLREREQKLNSAIQKLRQQRELLRNKRNDLNYPIVAVVGYTNAGKTSLIKSLTGEDTLQPKNQLFSTLDVTTHAGLLPSKLKILYIDTVGFISNIPTNLIECFVATLEDAVLADVILHVQDVSTDEFVYQRKHVEFTLKSLGQKTGKKDLLNKIISVGTKLDLAQNISESLRKDMILVSSKNMTGIDILKLKIEELVLKVSGRSYLKIRVPTGGDETRWLYKNATVVNQNEDTEDNQYQFLTVIITEAKIKQFYHYFVLMK